MFTLTREEILRISQIVISPGTHSTKTLKFSKSVMVFTEHGVSMLSSVLNSAKAVQVNIQIMRTFAKLREIMIEHKELSRRLDGLENKYDTQFKVVFDAIRQLMTEPEKPKRKIGFGREREGRKLVGGQDRKFVSSVRSRYPAFTLTQVLAELE